MQEETLQLESLETENTSIKQVNPMPGQDSESLQTQNIEENEVPDAQDTTDMQVQDDGTDSQVNSEQPDPDIPDDHTSRALQEDNYRTAIDDDEQDDTVQFGNPVTQQFLSRSIRVPHYRGRLLKFYANVTRLFTCLSATMEAHAYSQIQGMAQWLDMYLSKYPTQYINCMTSDSEFIAFVNHAIKLALDLTTYPNIWAVLLILLETQDVNTSYIQMMHDYDYDDTS